MKRDLNGTDPNGKTLGISGMVRKSSTSSLMEIGVSFLIIPGAPINHRGFS